MSNLPRKLEAKARKIGSTRADQDVGRASQHDHSGLHRAHLPGPQRQELPQGLRDGRHGGAQAGRVLADTDVQGAQRRQGQGSRGRRPAPRASEFVLSVSWSMVQVVETGTRAGPRTFKDHGLWQPNMEYRAKHRFADVTARKMRPFAQLIRGRNADEAMQLLKFYPNRGARRLEASPQEPPSATPRTRGARTWTN